MSGLRPVSAGNRRKPIQGHSSDVVSYEDLLVAQYLEELRKNNPNASASMSGSPSPYLQRLAHTHIVPTPGMLNGGTSFRRPKSATVWRPKSGKPKMDSKFIDNPDLWEPASPRAPKDKMKRRPASAPAFNNKSRPFSATYGRSRPMSAKPNRKPRAVYKRQPFTIVVTAYKNGSRDAFARVAAPSIKVLLEMATDRLGLSTAARRVFLEDGTEVFTPKEIMRDSDVYVSQGENFRDPLKPVKKQSEQLKTATWTMKGLMWTPDAKKRSTRPVLTKRFRTLIENVRRRVLVYRNGRGTEGVEIVADPNRFEDFLVSCTSKLDLESYARVLYDWEGKEVLDLNEAPVLDQCLQTWSTPVIGPLWVSKGGGFSPKGVEEFLTGLIAYTKAKLKEAKNYLQQLQFAKEDNTRDRVEIVAILSMSETEVDEALEIVNGDVEDFGNALNRLKEQMKIIEGSIQEENDEGYQYTLKNIEKFEMDHRMVGTKGLRLKVYENGVYGNETVIYFNMAAAYRGLGNDHNRAMERLLDQCSTSHTLANPKQNTAIRPMARKIYNTIGKEIKNVNDLEYDQEIWLSFGEPWKNPFMLCLTAQFDKIRGFDVEQSDSASKKVVIREQLQAEDASGLDRPGLWEATQGVPEEYSMMTIAKSTDPLERDFNLNDSAMYDNHISEVDTQGYFLKHKKMSDLVLYGEAVIDIKKDKGNKDLWSPDAQCWVFSKQGYIYNKGMPQMVLGVSGRRITTQLNDPLQQTTKAKTEGFVVSLQKKESSADQQFHFTSDGHIYAQSQPELFLTYLGGKYGDEESLVKNEADEKGPLGERYYVAVCEKIEGKDSKAQRWAIKQEKMENLGQWKHTKADNPDWNKKALSWPVDEKGELIEDFEWPMEGFLIPFAPPLAAQIKKKITPAPLRLMVLKNGVRDLSKATAVVGPDLTNMKKDTKEKVGKGRHKHSRTKSKPDNDEVNGDDLNVLKLEFILFLERATSMLDLPFAARRVFDASGREHFTMNTLQRDQLVYVSCGEAWSDPNLSKAEQQRRYLLSNLESDVAKIQQYIDLRDPQGLVLEVDGGLTPGSKLIINESVLHVSEDDQTTNQDIDEEDPSRRKEKEEFLQSNSHLSAHEKAHKHAEERLNSKKWPWERNGTEPVDTVAELNGTREEGRPRSSRPKRSRRDDAALSLQKFSFEDGYIQSCANSNYVLGISETEGRVAEVILVKRKQDDILQRWIKRENGLICTKNNPSMVLSVRLPTVAGREDRMPLSYIGCEIVVQQKKTTQFGRANQRFHFDEETNLIHAFSTDAIDKEITAANKANVCSFAVMGATEIDQPGYLVDMESQKSGKSKEIIVCSSCARAMGGRYKLEKVKHSIDFACAMGTAKEKGMKQIGSFKCLNGKVDLTTFEAEHTLEEWITQLDRLKEELSVRAIAKEISAARVPYTIKILAYINGEGRMKPGEIIVGSSVPGLLDQATSRLNMTQAARRMYTSDGTIVLDLDDLVTWVQDKWVADAKERMRAERRARKGLPPAGSKSEEEGGKLMDNVDLDSSDEEGTETETEKDGQQSTETSDWLIAGYEATPDRQYLDPWRSCVVIPNPAEEISCESGLITLWSYYAKKPGVIHLMVLRPDANDLNAFRVVGSVRTEAPSEGPYEFDCSQQPLHVQKGDVIGFYGPGGAVIPFDLDKDMDQAMYYVMSRVPPDVGQTLKCETWLQNGSRKYSLNAIIQPDSPEKQPKSSRGDGTVRDETEQQDLLRQQREEKKKKGKYVEPPPVEMVLRYPIEVWISCGEAFVKPEKVEKNHMNSLKQREERAAVSYELEKEKHILRQMQGRRQDGAHPGMYKSTQNPTSPVLIEGHWQELTIAEQNKHDTVHQLQTHLSQVKASQRKPKSVKSSSTLYSQPKMKRLLVFPNGDSVSKAQYVWGETLSQVLENATTRLNLPRAGQFLYSVDGELMSDFEDIERDQLLCISTKKGYKKPKDSQQHIEVKANWGRARKQYGDGATDIIVTANRNPVVDVDAFGPSTLAGGPTKAQRKSYATNQTGTSGRNGTAGPDSS